MLYHLLYPLSELIGGFNVFRYITFRAIVAALVALVFTIGFGKYFINYLKEKVASRQAIRRFTPKTHQKKSGTPSMGGLIILFALTLAVLISGNLANFNVLMALAIFWAFALLGFIDDYVKLVKRDGRGVNIRFKLIFQLFIALLVGGYLFYGSEPFTVADYKEQTFTYPVLFFPFLKQLHLDLSGWYWVLVVLVLLGSSNAVNLTDGLDGLAIGLSLFVLLTFIVLSYTSGHRLIAEYLRIPFLSQAAELTVFVSALAGACLGFLWYNSHPAQVFLGDTGSLALGGVIGFLALILKVELLLPIIGGVYMVEAFSVILQVAYRRYFNKRLFRLAPLHHHFELLGWHENKIISRFWIVGIILALLGIASLKVR